LEKRRISAPAVPTLLAKTPAFLYLQSADYKQGVFNMKKDFRFIKAFVFCVFFAGVVLSPALNAQSTQTAKSAFHGAWEIQTNKGIYVISFIDDIFTIYTRDG